MSVKKTAWHDGLFVSSEGIPSHTKGMGITIPYRFKRRHKRELLEIRRKAELPVDDSEHMDNNSADKALIELLIKIGIKWNWQDGDGVLLPQPENIEAFEEISDDELMFILAHLEDGTKIPPASAVV